MPISARALEGAAPLRRLAFAVTAVVSGLLVLAGCGPAPEVGSGRALHQAGAVVARPAGHYSFTVPTGFVEVAKYTAPDSGTGEKDSRSVILLPRTARTQASQPNYIVIDALTVTPLDLGSMRAQLTASGAQVSSTTVAGRPALQISEQPMSNPELDYIIDIGDVANAKAQNVSGIRVECHWRTHQSQIQQACNQLAASLSIA